MYVCIHTNIHVCYNVDIVDTNSHHRPRCQSAGRGAVLAGQVRCPDASLTRWFWLCHLRGNQQQRWLWNELPHNMGWCFLFELPQLWLPRSEHIWTDIQTSTHENTHFHWTFHQWFKISVEIPYFSVEIPFGSTDCLDFHPFHQRWNPDLQGAPSGQGAARCSVVSFRLDH